MMDVTGRVKRWLGHVEVLAGDIGPRLPGSENEARAAAYCRGALAEAGLEPVTEEFLTAGSVFRPHLVAALLLLTAFAVYPLALPVTGWVALALTVFAVASEIMEITLRPNPLQSVLPKRPSRNVYAVIEPAGVPAAGREGPTTAGRPEGVRDIVLIGHMDSQRTPIIFSTPGWMKAYRLFSTAAFAAFLGQVVLYAGGMVFGWPWAWAASGASAAMAFLLVLLTLQAELTPPTPGANDNATGAGLVLTLAEDLAAKPLVKSRVWCLCSGSEEALHEGAKAFFARHRSEMREPRAVVFEMLGCGRPAWGTKEGFVIPLWSAPGLRRLAGEVAAEHPQWGARPGGLAGGVTEMSDAILAGVPAITIICLDERGRAPYWHLPTDTVDKMDSLPGGAMDSAYRFVRAILERLDRSQG